MKSMIKCSECPWCEDRYPDKTDFLAITFVSVAGLGIWSIQSRAKSGNITTEGGLCFQSHHVDSLALLTRLLTKCRSLRREGGEKSTGDTSK